MQATQILEPVWLSGSTETPESDSFLEKASLSWR